MATYERPQFPRRESKRIHFVTDLYSPIDGLLPDEMTEPVFIPRTAAAVAFIESVRLGQLIEELPAGFEPLNEAAMTFESDTAIAFPENFLVTLLKFSRTKRQCDLKLKAVW